MSRMASHFTQGLKVENLYPQIGHSLLLSSIIMAHDGHSIFFIAFGSSVLRKES